MSKDRLEEIIEKVKRSDEYAEKGLWEASDGIIVHLHNEGYINYLIERVQELEEIIYQDERQALLEGMYEQNKRYRGALEFYADLKNWRKTHTERVNNSPSKVISDTGDKAREALEESE